MSLGGQGMESFPTLTTRDSVAEKLGIGSGKQYEKEKYIVDNADEITLTAWDKGDISTERIKLKVEISMKISK